jgi:hypothetical protein
VLGAAFSGALIGTVVSGAWWFERREPPPNQVSSAAKTARVSPSSAVSAAVAPGATPASESASAHIAPSAPALPHVAATTAVRANSTARRASDRDPSTAPTASVVAAAASGSFATTPVSAATGAARAANSNAPAEAARSTLDAEVRALANAQRELRAGRAALALSLLDAQAAQFSGGKLEQERQVARAVALCALGRASEARALAERLLQHDPDSPLAARLRNTCPATSAGSAP